MSAAAGKGIAQMSLDDPTPGMALFAGLAQDEPLRTTGITLQRIALHYDVEHDGRVYPQGLHLTLEIPVPLVDNAAQSVLLAILRLSRFKETSSNGHGPILWPPGVSRSGEQFETIATSLRTLAHLADLGVPPESYQRLEYYLKLFALIPIFYDNTVDKRSGSSHLLGYHVADGEDRLLIYLNRQWGSIIFRDRGQAAIDRKEQ